MSPAHHADRLLAQAFKNAGITEARVLLHVGGCHPFEAVLQLQTFALHRPQAHDHRRQPIVKSEAEQRRGRDNHNRHDRSRDHMGNLFRKHKDSVLAYDQCACRSP